MKFTEFTVATTSDASDLVADILWQYTTYGVAVCDYKDVIELIECRRETFDYIEKNAIRFDMLSLDCTNVDIPVPDTGHHMGFSNINRVVEKLRSFGAINEEAVICVNHFSHNGNPLHDHLSERAEEYGYLVSYDGFEVEF